MTLEEIVKQEGRQPDCSGYVTKYDIECSDGLTIRQGAFNDDNGRRVPLVWDISIWNPGMTVFMVTAFSMILLKVSSGNSMWIMAIFLA